MSNLDEIRWKQRFENFSKALKQLQTACEQKSYSDLELAGLARTFMFTYELGWKVLKDLLCYEGCGLNSPRAVIRQSFESSYLNERDNECFLESLEKRNRLSHIYDNAIAEEVKTLIKDEYHPMLHRLHQTLSAVRAK